MENEKKSKMENMIIAIIIFVGVIIYFYGLVELPHMYILLWLIAFGLGVYRKKNTLPSEERSLGLLGIIVSTLPFVFATLLLAYMGGIGKVLNIWYPDMSFHQQRFWQNILYGFILVTIHMFSSLSMGAQGLFLSLNSALFQHIIKWFEESFKIFKLARTWAVVVSFTILIMPGYSLITNQVALTIAFVVIPRLLAGFTLFFISIKCFFIPSQKNSEVLKISIKVFSFLLLLTPIYFLPLGDFSQFDSNFRDNYQMHFLLLVGIVVLFLGIGTPMAIATKDKSLLFFIDFCVLASSVILVIVFFVTPSHTLAWISLSSILLWLATKGGEFLIKTQIAKDTKAINN